MEIQITSNRENKLLERKEIGFSIVQEGSTPSKKEIKEELCKKLNLDPESVIIVKVEQSRGIRVGRGIAHAYPSKELVESSEPEHLVNRMKGIKGAKAAAGAKKEEAKPPAKGKK
jgi:ribosomal protein S24E